ncbi:MAG: polysaccharide deacetylase family protein [Hyphomicrobiaceae bacterium]
MKTLAQNTIAGLHRLARQRGLPSRVAIYFHELESHQRAPFRDAMVALRALGYRDVGPDDYVAGRGGDKLLFVSFDDNFKSWHQSRQLLDETGVRATFYVNSLPFRDRCSDAELAAFFERIRFGGERVTMTTVELRELARDGHTIGCHSHSHHLLSALPREAWDSEIRQSKVVLEEIIGQPVEHFAYPYGMRRCFSPALYDYCLEIGFRSVAAAIPAMLHAGPERRPMIQRSGWRFDQSVERNLLDLEVDGQLFERVTGRSAIG